MSCFDLPARCIRHAAASNFDNRLSIISTEHKIFKIKRNRATLKHDFRYLNLDGNSHLNILVYSCISNLPY